MEPADDPKSGYTPSVRLLKIQENKKRGKKSALFADAMNKQLVVAENCFWQMIRSAPTAVIIFSMDLIGERILEMFSHYEDSIYEYIYSLKPFRKRRMRTR